jgi:hypothetical protein
MKKILLFGNCQTGGIKEIIQSWLHDYNIEIILCWITDITKEIFTYKIQNADIIITQPINDNYREREFLNTNYIIKNANQNTKIFIFPSLHFNFYYFDCGYKFHNNKLINTPSDYHYYNLIENYENKKDFINFINNCVKNKDFKSSEYLIDLANKSIDELINRENKLNDYIITNGNCNIIIVSTFINDNYKKKLLFYSINHPTKYLLHYISIEILKILGINYNGINTNIDPLYSNERCILYECIKNVVEFDINKHNPKHNNVENINDICYNYYKSYDTVFI